MTKSNQYDLIVCGGGVVGLSIAWWASRHSWKVLLLEQRSIGKGASWHGAGILPASPTVHCEDPLEQLRALSHRYHEEWAKLLFDQTSIDNGYRPCGGVYLGRSLAERATLMAQEAWWSEHGIDFQRLDEDQLVKQVPALQHLARSSSKLQSWYLPKEAQIRNPWHLQALRRGCELQGVDIIEACDWQSWIIANDVQGVKTGKGSFTAERYCIAAGSWSQSLLEPFGIETGILPVRGQMLLFRTQADKPLFSQVINDGHRYLVPREDGRILAGSSEEEVGFDETTTDEVLGELLEWSRGIVPELTSEKIERSWAGLRPGSFDSMPYLGQLPQNSNVFVAAGHFRNGLHLSPGTAMVMWEAMNGIKLSIPIDAFSILRGRNTFR